MDQQQSEQRADAAEQWRFNSRTTADEVLAGVDLAGKIFLVTGGNSGIGKETCLSLARAGAQVIVGARNSEAAEAVVREIKEETHNDKVSFLLVDLASLQSVRNAAAAFKALNLPRLDVLICNAGVMALTEIHRTVDGFEQQFGTNHLGHFVLGNLLLPELLKAEKPRVVVLSSVGHARGGVPYDDINYEKEGSYTKWGAYGASKTANILFAMELDKRYHSKGLTANAVHPGGIMTNLQKELTREEMIGYGWMDSEGKLHELFKSPQQGASTTVWAAVAPELEGRGGNYLEDCRISTTSTPDSRDPANAERLWKVSEELVGQTFDVL